MTCVEIPKRNAGIRLTICQTALSYHLFADTEWQRLVYNKNTERKGKKYRLNKHRHCFSPNNKLISCCKITYIIWFFYKMWRAVFYKWQPLRCLSHVKISNDLLIGEKSIQEKEREQKWLCYSKDKVQFRDSVCSTFCPFSCAEASKLNAVLHPI